MQSIRFMGSWGRVGGVLFAAALLVAGAPAAATALPEARLDIVATPPSVTRSSASLATYASYRMTITSQDRDRLKHFKFKGAVAVQGLPAGSSETATLFSTEGATCTLTAGVLECAVPGELNCAGDTLGFTVTLKTPAAGSAIGVSGKVSFVEHYYYWKFTNTATAPTALTEPSPDSVSSFVPTAAVDMRLFSGTNTATGVVGAIPIVDAKAVPPINDPFTTTVIVPAGSGATMAAVAERELLASCSANPRCFETALTIPGSFDFLTIILRRDRTTLLQSKPPKGKGHDHHDDGKKGHGHDDDDDGRYSGQASIDNAIVKYFPDDDPAQPDKFIIVPNCNVVPGGVPSAKNPCIAARKAYPTKSTGTTPVPAGLEGDWEFVILAVDNGRYIN